MTIAYWCVFAAILMPYPLTIFAKRKMSYGDNKAPRAYKATLTGASQRAAWAVANTSGRRRAATLPRLVAVRLGSLYRYTWCTRTACSM